MRARPPKETAPVAMPSFTARGDDLSPRLYLATGRCIVAGRMTPPRNGGSVSRPRVASQRFRRFPVFGPEHERRVAWGHEWGKVGAAVRKMIEEGKV